MPGESDPIYVRARPVLLDALEALEYLRNLFGTADAAGSRMAARAAAPLDDPDTIALSCEALARRLLERLSRPPF